MARWSSAASGPRGRNRGSDSKRLRGVVAVPCPTTSMNATQIVPRPRRLQQSGSLVIRGLPATRSEPGLPPETSAESGATGGSDDEPMCK